MTAEIMEFIGKTDKNGNTARLRVDVANRKFYRDFVSFTENRSRSKSRQSAKWSKRINGSAGKKKKFKEIKI